MADDIQFTPDEIRKLKAAAAEEKAQSSESSSDVQFTPEEIKKLQAASDDNKRAKFENATSYIPMLGASAGTVKGLAKSAIGVSSFLSKLVGMSDTSKKINKSGESAINKFENVTGDNASIKTGDVIGQTIPYLVGGELAPIKMAGEGAVKFLPKALSSGPVRRFFTKAALRTPGGAFMGASAYDPSGENTGKNAAMGTALNVALPPALSAATNLVAPKKAIAKTIAFFTNKTPEEMLSNPSQLVGDVVGSKWLKRLETNTLPTVAGSGYAKKMDDVYANLENKGNNVYKNLTSGKTQDASDAAIKDAMVKYDEHLGSEVGSMYQDIFDEANKSGVTSNLGNYFNTAEELAKKFGRTKQLSGITKDSGSLSQLQEIIDTAKNGANKGPASLEDVHFIKSTIGDKLATAQAQTNKDAESIFSQLYGAISKDFDDAIEKSGNDGLKKQYADTQKFFKENVLPFRQGVMPSILNGTKDINTIKDYFLPKSGKNRLERVKLLKKVAPGAEKDIMTSFLEDAMNYDFNGDKSLDVSKLYELLNKLGYKRLKELTPGKEGFNSIDDFMKTYEKDRDALVNFKNFPTGFSNIASDNAKSTGGLLIDAVMHPGSLPSNVSKAAAGPLFGRALSSPTFISDVIRSKSGEEISPISSILKRLMTAAIIQQSASSGGA